MGDMAAFFNEMVVLSKHTDSLTHKEEAVKAFIERNCHERLPALAGRRAVDPSTQLTASRTDVRAVPYIAVSGAPTAPSTGTSIFANQAYHVDAAATLGGLAARESGFSSSMVAGSIEESTKLFEAYVKEFADAPHWLYEAGVMTEVQHSNSDHAQFTRDLAEIITQQMDNINTGQEAIDAAVQTVTTLATLQSNSAENGSSKTLYSTIGMSRQPGNRGPLYYGIFYMTLEMEHQVNGKSKVVSNNATTYSLMYRLDSSLLVRYAYLYDTLIKTQVDDWFASLEIF